MLDAQRLVAGLLDAGFTHVCVVPCSFASSLINAVINSPELEYVPAASEAIACSIAAGVKMAGGKPLVIAQSSGVTNMGSCITSLLKPYNIPLAILASWRQYQPGDSEIQHQQLAKTLPALVSAYGLQSEPLDITSEERALAQLLNADATGTVLILQEGSFAPQELMPEHALDLSGYPGRVAYLETLLALISADIALIGTTGNTGRELHACGHSARNFYMAGNMGGALSVGLGAALQGSRVVVLGGDAEFSMHMGGLTTAGRYRDRLPPGSLLYIVFDNASNKSTGGQRSYQEHVDYLAVAAACGLSTPEKTIVDLEAFEQELIRSLPLPSPRLLHVMCGYDPVAPRPDAADICASVEALRGRGNS